MVKNSVCVVSVLSIVESAHRHLGIAGAYVNREVALEAIKSRGVMAEHRQTFNQDGTLKGERVTLHNEECYDLHTFEVWQTEDEGLGA